MSLRDVPTCAPKRGQCTWCGLPVLHERGPKAGTANTNRTWHSHCSAAWKLHALRPAQIAHIIERDGRKCAQCGDAPEAFVSDLWGRKFSQVWDCRTRDNLPYTPLRRVSTLELDHKTPLWSVQHLQPLDRRPYFGPDNLWLLCPPCHKAKTAREAGERGRFKLASKSKAIAA